MNLDFDENVKNKQQEWSSLLQLEDLNIQELPACPLETNERLFLATLWLHDGTKGGNIDFPQTSYQLKCYELTRSHYSLIIFSIVFFLHLSFPFFEQPYCAWTSSGTHDYDYNQSKSNNYLSPHTASILELFCLVFYLIEIYLRLAINSGSRQKRGLDFYTKLRLFIVVLLIWDCMTSVIYYQPEKMIRALVPIIYITRRKSLRQMAWGLIVVAYKCIPVFFLLLSIIIAWSYLGRMIFGNLDLDGKDQFGSLVDAFLTTLESYSCRGYVLFTLDPLFRINAGSSLFFVSLTIFADIFCQALIVATGTRQYQLYSVTIFRKELLNRKKAILAVFGILQQHTQELAFQAAINNQTQQLTEAISNIPNPILNNNNLNNNNNNIDSTLNTPLNPPPQSQSQPSSSSSSVNNSRPSSSRSIFDPNSIIQRTTKNFWKDRTVSNESGQSDSVITQQSFVNRESLYNPKVDNSDLRVSKQAWLDFCSHLKGKYKISPELAELLFDKEIELQEESASIIENATNRLSWNRDSFNNINNNNNININNKKKSKPINEGLSVVGLFRLAALLDGEINVEGDIDSDEELTEEELSKREKSLPRRRRSSSEQLNIRKISSSQTLQSDPGSGIGIMLAGNLQNENNQSNNNGNNNNNGNGNNNNLKKKNQNYLYKFIKYLYKKSIIFARYIAEAYIILDFTIPFTSTRSMSQHIIFDIFIACTRILLAVQLLYVTIPHSAVYWYDIGWALQFFFWFEMYIRVASPYVSNIRRHFRLLVINVITTALLFTMDRKRTKEDEISGRMIAYICFQWIRLIRVALPFRISTVIKSLLSLILRVVFLIFAVIYFFSTIGYYRFCNAFDVEEAEDVDDWANKWAPYYKQLNFNTMLQTLYTLFEVAILGSWSYVMRAAMLSGFLSALFFFYAYRLVMTLVVIPILTSFIIQAYNARSIKAMNDERILIEKRLQEKQQQKELNQTQTDVMNVIIEEDENENFQQNDTFSMERKTDNTQLDDTYRISRATTGTVSNHKVERKLVVTRASTSDHSMISYWSSSGNENAAPIVKNNNTSPRPSTMTNKPSFSINNSSTRNSTTTTTTTSISPNISKDRDSTISSTSNGSKSPQQISQQQQQQLSQEQESEQVRQLTDIIKELNSSLLNKSNQYEKLLQDAEKILQENMILKNQMKQLTETYDGNNGDDETSLFEE